LRLRNNPRFGADSADSAGSTALACSHALILLQIYKIHGHVVVQLDRYFVFTGGLDRMFEMIL